MAHCLVGVACVCSHLCFCFQFPMCWYLSHAKTAQKQQGNTDMTKLLYPHKMSAINQCRRVYYVCRMTLDIILTAVKTSVQVNRENTSAQYKMKSGIDDFIPLIRAEVDDMGDVCMHANRP